MTDVEVWEREFRAAHDVNPDCVICDQRTLGLDEHDQFDPECIGIFKDDRITCLSCEVEAERKAKAMTGKIATIERLVKCTGAKDGYKTFEPTGVVIITFGDDTRLRIDSAKKITVYERRATNADDFISNTVIAKDTTFLDDIESLAMAEDDVTDEIREAYRRAGEEELNAAEPHRGEDDKRDDQS